jgi:DNA-directed RNA polymerase subunit RPC12/RpoP
MEDEMEYEWNPDWKPPVKKHEYTTERIYHFTCGRCSNWWSYATTEQNSLINSKTNWGCPHCSHQANLKKKEN